MAVALTGSVALGERSALRLYARTAARVRRLLSPEQRAVVDTVDPAVDVAVGTGPVTEPDGRART